MVLFLVTRLGLLAFKTKYFLHPITTFFRSGRPELKQLEYPMWSGSLTHTHTLTLTQARTDSQSDKVDQALQDMEYVRRCIVIPNLVAFWTCVAAFVLTECNVIEIWKYQ